MDSRQPRLLKMELFSNETAALRGLHLLTCLLSVHFQQLAELGGGRAHGTLLAALDMQLAVFCYEVEKHEFWSSALKMGLERSRKTEVSSANAGTHFRDHPQPRRGPANTAQTNISPKLSRFFVRINQSSENPPLQPQQNFNGGAKEKLERVCLKKLLRCDL